MANTTGKKFGGRKKGTPNKVTRDVKAAIERCFEDIGGDAKFAEWAQENPTEFYKLWGKLLPSKIEGVGKPLLLLRDYAGK